MIFTYPNDFWHKRKIDHFDPCNVLLAIATDNIPVLLITGFEQTEVSSVSLSSSPFSPLCYVEENLAAFSCSVGVAATVTLDSCWGGLPREWAGNRPRKRKRPSALCSGTFSCGYHDAESGYSAALTSVLVFVWGKGIPEVCVCLCSGCEGSRRGLGHDRLRQWSSCLWLYVLSSGRVNYLTHGDSVWGFSLSLMLSVSYDGPVALAEFNSIFNVMCKSIRFPMPIP